MTTKIELTKERQLELLKILVIDTFGINAKFDFTKWNMESDRITIENIDWSEDLLTILDRLREHFYIFIETETSEIEVEGQKAITSHLNLELIYKC